MRTGGTAAALAAAVASAVVAAAAGLQLQGGAADAAALTVIVLAGLPHGALDLRELAADGRSAGRAPVRLAVYLGLAAAAGAVWAVSPALALTGFLAIAVAHFAEEAADDLPRAVAWPAAALVIAAPALFHPDAVRRLFSALGGADAGAWLTAGAGALAPVLAAALALAAILRPPRPERGTELLAVLVAFVLLPPLPAFAVYFAGLHSPRRFFRTARSLGFAAPAAVRAAAPATLAALALGAVVWATGARAPDAAARAAFILLAVLTVPHMAAGPLLRALAQAPWRTRQPSTTGSSGEPSTAASSRSTETTRSALSVRST